MFNRKIRGNGISSTTQSGRYELIGTSFYRFPRKTIVFGDYLLYNYHKSHREKVIMLADLIDVFDEERTCEYKGEIYSVRDNGSVMRHPRDEGKPRSLDNKWTFGRIDSQHGYPVIGSVPIHRIVATAFLGEAPSKSHVVDHIDTNRQNNRPSNLRWLTRLENILFNEITRTKLELLCGCSIEVILNDLSILKDKPLTPQFSWMKAVSKEEAEKSLETWRNWANKVAKMNDSERRALRENYLDRYDRSRRNGMIYPLEPTGGNVSLDIYYANLKNDEVFCYKEYQSGRYSYVVKDFCLNKETNVLSVATTIDGGIKSFLTSITIENNDYCYDTQSFFNDEGLNKYMTIARGEEWTGGEVIEDYM